MEKDLVRGYEKFLTTLIKLYVLGDNVIQKELDFFIGEVFFDASVFFLIAFDSMDLKKFQNLLLKNREQLMEYVAIDREVVVLTQKGEKIKASMHEKLISQAQMLEFNGIKAQYLGHLVTILKRFQKFWTLLQNIGKKAR